jgi:predicted nucleic acid-binding protein
MPEKYSNDIPKESVVCDSSSLVSMSDSCLLWIISELSKSFKGYFIISKTVEYESVMHPLDMKSHTLGAIRLKKLLLENVVKVVETPNSRSITSELLSLGNSVFSIGGRNLKLIHEGETETLALAIDLGVRNILIDERTTRMLIEAPLDLKSHMEGEFQSRIDVNEKHLRRFLDMTNGLNLFRSTELAIVGYEKGLFNDYVGMEKRAIEAVLYGLKFAGCGISFSEIDEFCNSLR